MSINSGDFFKLSKEKGILIGYDDKVEIAL
jgi:hypothetical protein